MTWIKLDDNAVDHPKIASLSDRAFRWWIRGLSYASRFLTDGILPKVFWKQVPNRVRSELVEVRLWDWIDPHFLIHDYAHHQSLKAEVEADKERNREKAAAYREKRRAERRERDRLAPGDVTGNASLVSDRVVTTPENREQIQRTDTENKYTRTDVRFDAWWKAYPKKASKGAAIKAWLKLKPDSDTVAKMLEALQWQRNQPQWTKDGGAFIPHPATYLNARKWEDEPFFTPASTAPLESSPEHPHLRKLRDMGVA